MQTMHLIGAAARFNAGHVAPSEAARVTPRVGARASRESCSSPRRSLAALILAAAAIVGRSLLNLENANLNSDESRLLIAELSVRYDK
jgi:hypothetical protein